MDDSNSLTFFYHYEVDGVSYTNKAIDLFGREASMVVAEMDQFVQTYPAGVQVKVHYAPNDPAVSVIELDHGAAYSRNRGLAALLIAGSCFGFGVHFFQ